MVNFKMVLQEASPGFGIVTQRPDGKGAMVNGIEPGSQAASFGIGDGWAISRIDNVEILEMPFVKDFNEIGAGTKAGVTAIAEILGGLNAPFTVEFVELPKREFSKAIDLWSLGVSLHVMLTGKKPFEDEPVHFSSVSILIPDCVFASLSHFLHKRAQFLRKPSRNEAHPIM